MLMPDVNILIYAHRTDETDHAFYRDWMETLGSGPEPFAISALVAAAFLRIVRHPGFAPEPTPLPQAIGVIESLKALPTCRFYTPGVRHWAIFRHCVETRHARGKLVADAQHASLAIEYGCEWVTRDTDSRRFKAAGLRLQILEP